MEKPILKQMDEIITSPNVVGALVADQDGLCISSQGISSPKSTAGLIASLSMQANRLSTGATIGSSSPVVVIETENTCVLVKTDDGITTAVFKSA